MRVDNGYQCKGSVWLCKVGEKELSESKEFTWKDMLLAEDEIEKERCTETYKEEKRRVLTVYVSE